MLRNLPLCAVFALICASPAFAVPPGDLVLVPAVSSGIGSPIALRHAGDGSHRLFIVWRYGQIWI